MSEVAPVLLDPGGVFGGVAFALEGGEGFAFVAAECADGLGGISAVGPVSGDLVLRAATAVVGAVSLMSAGAGLSVGSGLGGVFALTGSGLLGGRLLLAAGVFGLSGLVLGLGG